MSDHGEQVTTPLCISLLEARIIMYAYSNGSFYPFSLIEAYQGTKTWPDNYIEVDEAVFTEFSRIPPAGKMRGTGYDGMPVWVDIPPLSHEELVAEAGREKQRRIDEANDFINGKQWPGKAAMGRLTEVEKMQYNLWLDYLDNIGAVDTQLAPNIIWP